jgi:hypothetical protein
MMWTEIHCGTGLTLFDFIAEPWEPNTLHCLVTNLLHNPYCPFAIREEYKYMQCKIKMTGLKTYYDNVLKEENTTLYFSRYKHRDCIQKLMVSMPHDQALWW